MVSAGGGGGGGGGGTGGPQQSKLITNRTLDDLRAIPGVLAVIPRDYLSASATIKYNRLETGANIIGLGTDNLADLGLETSQGNLQLEKGTIIIGPMVANNFYDPNQRPGQEPPTPPDLYDQQVIFMLMKWDQNGNQTTKTLTYKVIGVLNETRGESDWSIYMRLEDVKAFNEWAMGRRINYNKDGYSMVIVKVKSADQVLNINDQITAMGYQTYTSQSFVQGINNFYLVLQIIFGGVGAIALLVAAIGIANTMAMAILERTREIGLMKAVGATNRDVLSIFLGEAAGIGFLGGLGGVLVGWLAGQGINVAALVYFANQASQQGAAPPSVAVYTPAWLPLFALFFATLIGFLSGLYPALRAATMIPVLALKYE
jgi:putative ABC transport system permease protein